MDFLWWVIVILFFIGSFIGIVVPFIPDAILLWGGFLTYQFLIGKQGLPGLFWWGIGALTLLLVLSDFLTNILVVKKYGGSKWGMAASILGMVLGPLVLGPFGILIGPLLLVFLMEWSLRREISAAVKIALGSLAALFSSVLVKCALQTIMIAWFFFAK